MIGANPAVQTAEADRHEAFKNCDIAAIKKALCRSMTIVKPGRVTDMASTPDTEEVEFEASAALPPDKPPGFNPPMPHMRPAIVEVSADFIRSLRSSYGQDAGDAKARKIGRRSDVQTWLDGLNAGQVSPRPS